MLPFILFLVYTPYKESKKHHPESKYMVSQLIDVVMLGGKKKTHGEDQSHKRGTLFTSLS